MMDLKNLSPGVHMRLMLGWAISNATVTNTIMIHFIINAGTCSELIHVLGRMGGWVGVNILMKNRTGVDQAGYEV